MAGGHQLARRGVEEDRQNVSWARSHVAFRSTVPRILPSIRQDMMLPTAGLRRGRSKAACGPSSGFASFTQSSDASNGMVLGIGPTQAKYEPTYSRCSLSDFLLGIAFWPFRQDHQSHKDSEIEGCRFSNRIWNAIARTRSSSATQGVG